MTYREMTEIGVRNISGFNEKAPHTPHPTPLKQDLVSVISRQIHGRYRE